MEQQGDVSVSIINTWPELDEALDRHCSLESRSWKYRSDLHIDRDREHFVFYFGLEEAFSENGNFELRLLELDGQPIASTFGIIHGNSFQSLIIAHDQSYDNLSPGTVLKSYELENLLSSQLRRYEFLGSFLTNKLRWTDDVIHTRNVHVYSRSVRLRWSFYRHFVLKRKAKALLKRAGLFEYAERA
jgi:CelD/BcsL family acetyltransferase involved in cellulose biosynthesis